MTGAGVQVVAEAVAPGIHEIDSCLVTGRWNGGRNIHGSIQLIHDHELNFQKSDLKFFVLSLESLPMNSRFVEFHSYDLRVELEPTTMIRIQKSISGTFEGVVSGFWR